METTAWIIGSLLIGGFIGFILKRNRTAEDSQVAAALQEKIRAVETENAVIHERLSLLSTEKERFAREFSEFQQKAAAELKSEKEIFLSELKIERERLSAQFAAEKEKLNIELSQERESHAHARVRIAKAEEIYNSMKTQLAEKDEMQKKLTTEFENLANKILDEKSKKFTEQNKSNLDTILSPLKEKIEKFEKKVDESYDKELRDKISLREEVRKLYDLNSRISQEANNLTRALKGDNKKQGNWGEIILEKILERSDLVKDREYSVQYSTENSEGNIIRPDVVVHLPEDKHIIIDSKVSLVAYEQYVNSEDEEERVKFMKAHLDSVKSHVRILNEKNYQTGKGLTTPDFVLLFIPIESSFSVAVQADNELFGFAWEKKIVIVSPSTLLATLRTIASIWKQERQTKNALEIARIGGSMYDELVRFIDDLKDIEKHLNKSQEAWGSAYKRLSTGRGNLVTAAEKIRTLGAKTTKSIEKDLSENALILPEEDEKK